MTGLTPGVTIFSTISAAVAASAPGDTINVADAEEVPGQDAIRDRTHPIKPEGSMAILHGNLATRGAVIKHSAASPKLLQHTGRAVVFDSVEDERRHGKEQLAGALRVFGRFGFGEGVAGHITVRDP